MMAMSKARLLILGYALRACGLGLVYKNVVVTGTRANGVACSYSGAEQIS